MPPLGLAKRVAIIITAYTHTVGRQAVALAKVGRFSFSIYEGLCFIFFSLLGLINRVRLKKVYDSCHNF